LILEPDQNLIYYDEKTSQWYYINDLVKCAIYQYYRFSIKYTDFISRYLPQYVKDILRVIQNETTPRRTKEDLLKRLIEYSIQNSIKRQEDYQIHYYSQTRQETVIKLPLRYTRIKPFTTSQDLETQILQIIRGNDVGILVPSDPDCPYADFIMIDARNQQDRLIYLIKVAINIKNHENSDIVYQNDIKNLTLGTNTRSESISKVMFKITQENIFVKTKFLWMSGDDLWSNVNPEELLNTSIRIVELH
jgi:hypothetical protein